MSVEAGFVLSADIWKLVAFLFLLLMLVPTGSVGRGVTNLEYTEEFVLSDDVQSIQLLDDSDIENAPDVFVNGTPTEYTWSFADSSQTADSYLELTWEHTAGTEMDWCDSESDAYPDCNDFIYFTQECEWSYPEIPLDVNVTLEFSVSTLGSFSTYEEAGLMFKVYAWFIDSSDNWNRIYRSYPPYSQEPQFRRVDLSYIDITEGWGGMIENEDGVQEDPEDKLRYAIGLAPTDDFHKFMGSEPWTTYTGQVSVQIYSSSVTAFLPAENIPDANDNILLISQVVILSSIAVIAIIVILWIHNKRAT